MRSDHPPPVHYELGPSRLHTGVFVGLTLLMVTSFGLWIAMSERLGWAHLWATLAGAIAWLWAFRGWSVQPAESLHWDGQTWLLHRGEAVISVLPRVVVDLQGHLLLYLAWQTPLKGQSWAWPSASKQPNRWLALRRALVASSRYR